MHSVFIDKKITLDNIISDIRFNGEACAISTASTSIMLKNIMVMWILEF